MKLAHQKPIPENIQDSAGGKAHHGKQGLPLKAEHVVQHAARAHKGRCEQNVKSISPCIGQYGLRTAQEIHKGVQKKKAKERHDPPRQHCRKKSRGGIGGSLVHLLRAKGAGADAAASLSEHKTEGLYDGHESKYNAHRAGGAGARGTVLLLAHAKKAGTVPADEKGICHIINACDQHADGRRDAKLDHKRRNGCLRHLPKLRLLSFCHFLIVHFSVLPNPVHARQSRLSEKRLDLLRAFLYVIRQLSFRKPHDLRVALRHGNEKDRHVGAGDRLRHQG